MNDHEMRENMDRLPEDIRRVIRESGLSPETIEGLREQLIAGIDFARINQISGELRRPDEADIIHLSSESSRLKELESKGLDALRAGEVGLLILNGGMATRFGGRVKGAVEVAQDTSFLGFKLLDALRVSRAADASPPPVILMNSQATMELTREHLEKNDYFG